ncbi:MAG: MerR family transcriptional regulator [Myxococcota bacterium]|nr:MerR family transcriptional regulator [Myxococcota bacterium]
MAEQQKTYSIGKIAQLANLSAHTIRAWERRYNVVTPLRSEGGTRRYTESHLKRFQLLGAAVDAGHRISDLVELDQAILAQLAGTVRTKAVERPSSSRKGEYVTLDPRSVTEAIGYAKELDATNVERCLGIQYRLLGPSTFRTHFCRVLLTRVGTLWEQGEISMATEHLLSAALKSLLLRTFDSSSTPANAPKVVFTTPDDEQHELGLLIAAGVAADAGAEVINLGPQLPADIVAQAVLKQHPFALALSMVNVPLGTQRAYVRRLRTILPDQIQIWLGGADARNDIAGCEVLGLEEMANRIRDVVAMRTTAS